MVTITLQYWYMAVDYRACSILLFLTSFVQSDCSVSLGPQNQENILNNDIIIFKFIHIKYMCELLFAT